MRLRDEETAQQCLFLMAAIGLLLFAVGCTLVVVGYYIPGVDHVVKDMMVANGYTIAIVGLAIIGISVTFLYMSAKNKLDLSTSNLNRGNANMTYSGSRDLDMAGRGAASGW
eukprot:TRINITY_DN14938_c0_g1_i1.p1 TRINITY_DN14938_c0_g1~~TRINITY_DN14938_c0_g1_i1.p1  ORF type:complete len:112 (+),score=3.08 TRINITY_DN14938_c0_g1_i1:50-385(+)